ncbi:MULTISPECIES: acyl carrier protein [unclassified Streptomyces]|uniref:acyl carrier protein n=1 Tax=unclassified Streptomyces TaxID=2593676 RepID=UPI0036779244
MTSTLPTDGTTADLAARVRTAWARGLGHDEFHDDEHFFEVGGHSMCAVRIVRALKTELGIPLTVRDFFAHPTVAGLALHLTDLAATVGDGTARAEAGA